MLTIPVHTADPAGSPRSGSTPSVLVIGRSEKVLDETVDLIRKNGRAAGATNDFDNVLTQFDVSSLDIVVFGGMVPPETKKSLRTNLAAADPTIAFVQGLAGIPGLIAEQAEAALVSSHRHPAAVDYDGATRTVTISLQSAEDVRVTGFFHTALVPPDPESSSRVIFDDTLDSGTHTVRLPASIPTAASFVVVRVEADVQAFVVGPMPRGTTMASPPA